MAATEAPPNPVLLRIRSYPTLTVIGVAFVLLIVFETLFPPSKAAAPGFILSLFSLGAYTAVSVVYGFMSIFGRTFITLTFRNKLRVLLLSLAVLIPSSGIGSFVVVACREILGQMQCVGAGCAQGGIATMLFLQIAWVCYFIVIGLSMLLSYFGWWPKGIAPKFLGKW